MLKALMSVCSVITSILDLKRTIYLIYNKAQLHVSPVGAY